MNQIVANVTVILCVAACIGGGIFAWWVENRPGNEETQGEDQKSSKGTEKKDDLPGGEL
ncbi:MAG: hypothetical protein J6M66_14155 [Lachnospiraceae bacterium]|nr:hypothetical protein [Lachnospiraceae bacterium]